MSRTALALAASLACASACRREPPPSAGLRLGFLPNVTHAQALVGIADGSFASALGGRLRTRQFNAGPAAMEALLAGELDVAYVGPGPAAIAYLRSGGEALRVVAGATSGGAGLFVRGARTPSDLRGRKVASPQLGNTQDIALRTWLRREGIPVGAGGVEVTPLSGADILGLMRRGQLEGAWIPEPWGARLLAEAGAHLLVDERDLWPEGRFPSAGVVASARALRARRADVVALLRAHGALTARWKADPAAFARAANAELARLTGHALADAVVRDAFSRLEPTADPLPAALDEEARRAQALGFAPDGQVSGMVDVAVLDEVARAPPP